MTPDEWRVVLRAFLTSFFLAFGVVMFATALYAASALAASLALNAALATLWMWDR